MISSHLPRREVLPKDQLLGRNEYGRCIDSVLNLLDLLGLDHLTPKVIRREVARALDAGGHLTTTGPVFA